jgi:polyisoprenoid-binding protein YceI
VLLRPTTCLVPCNDAPPLPPSMRTLIALIATVAGVMPLARGVCAQSAYVLDRSNSRVTFRGRAFIQQIFGRSEELAGRVVMSGGDVRSLRGDVRFNVASIATDPAVAADELLKLFGGDRHPTITFQVDSIERGGEVGPWKVHGRLTMNGVTRAVAFSGQANVTGRQVVASGTTLVDVRDWGIRPPRRFGGLIGMSPEITLTFRAEFRARGGGVQTTALSFPDRRSNQR